MRLTIPLTTLAISTIAHSNAAALKPRQGDKFGIEDLLSSVKSIYRDPSAVEYFASEALEYVSSVLPPSGSIPSEQELQSALAVLENQMAPSMISSLISGFGDSFEHFGTISAYSSEIAYGKSVLHGSSVSSRLNDVVQQLFHDITSDYGDGAIGQPTAAAEEENEATTDDKNEDSANDHIQEENETQEDTTSGAPVTSASMLLMLTGAVTTCLF